LLYPLSRVFGVCTGKQFATVERAGRVLFSHFPRKGQKGYSVLWLLKLYYSPVFFRHTSLSEPIDTRSINGTLRLV
jgi:hypothetical protein